MKTQELNPNMIDSIRDKFNHVLIIEDDPCYSDLLVLYTNNFAKKITAFDCVEKAEKFLKNNKVDLVITDYFIKDRKFGSSIVDTCKDTPIILVSGDMEAIESATDFKLDKISCFIDKPVDPNLLYDSVKWL